MGRYGYIIGLACLIIVAVISLAAIRQGGSALPPATHAPELAAIVVRWDTQRVAEVAAVLGVEWEAREGSGVDGGPGSNYIMKVPVELESPYRALFAHLEAVQRDPSPQGDVHLLIRFQPHVTEEVVTDFTRAMGAHLVRHWQRSDAYEFALPSGADPEQYAEWMKLSPLVQWVEVNEAVVAGNASW